MRRVRNLPTDTLELEKEASGRIVVLFSTVINHWLITFLFLKKKVKVGVLSSWYFSNEFKTHSSGNSFRHSIDEH